MTPEEKRDYMREYMRAYRAANREKIRAIQAGYRERNREEIKLRQRAWSADNKDRIHGYYMASRDEYIARSKQRYEENREQILAQMSEYQRERLKDPEFYQRKLQAWHKRRARMLANGPVEDIDRRAVWGRDSGCCTICGEFVPFGEMELDHIVPLSQGGTHTWANVQTACLQCNRSKGSKVLLGVAGRQ